MKLPAKASFSAIEHFPEQQRRSPGPRTFIRNTMDQAPMALMRMPYFETNEPLKIQGETLQDQDVLVLSGVDLLKLVIAKQKQKDLKAELPDTPFVELYEGHTGFVHQKPEPDFRNYQLAPLAKKLGVTQQQLASMQEKANQIYEKAKDHYLKAYKLMNEAMLNIEVPS